MRRFSAIVLSLAALKGCATSADANSGWRSASALRTAFHHIHVNEHSPESLLTYYGKLFDSATTKPVKLGRFRGMESNGVFLLITPVREEPPESGGAGWHFGWGTVSLDEAYDRHRMKEVDLKLPIESFAKELHLHLESEDPIRAASWYRNELDARITTDARVTKVRPPNPLHRRPAAIVELPGITLAIYQAAASLAASRGRRIDHIAFTADLDEARDAGFVVLENAGRLGPFETMTIEGPDRLAIELVGTVDLSARGGRRATRRPPRTTNE